MTSIRLITTLFVAITALASPELVNACKCGPPPPPTKAMKRAAAVFSGKVTVIKQVGNQKQITFKVLKIWKGKLGKEVVVTTPIHSASCGYNFAQQGDGTYLLYCHQSNNAKLLSAGRCSRTRTLASAAKDLKELGDGRAPK